MPRRARFIAPLQGCRIDGDAAAIDGICSAVLAAIQVMRSVVPKPIQVLFMRRGAVSDGIGAIYSSQSHQGGNCSGFNGIEIIPPMGGTLF